MMLIATEHVVKLHLAFTESEVWLLQRLHVLPMGTEYPNGARLALTTQEIRGIVIALRSWCLGTGQYVLADALDAISSNAQPTMVVR